MMDSQKATGLLRSLWEVHPDAAAHLGVSLNSITVQFGGVKALDDVSLDLPGGDVVAVIGPNGAGKSTLLNAVSGLLGAQATGSIVLEGREIGKLSPAARAAAGIGRSFQDPPLVAAATVVENVMAGGHTTWQYGGLAQLIRWRHVAAAEREARHRALRLLEFLGLERLADQPAAQLAYGPRKLIDVARALMGAPRLLLLDEPSSGLDRNEQAAIVRVLKALREIGQVTVLVVEHHMDVVRACADEVVGLQAGEVIAHGPAAAVLDSPDFRAALVAKA